MRRIFLIVVITAVPLVAWALTVEGTNYPNTVKAGGKTLKLVGAGLREKFFFDVYTMGVYTENHTCDTRRLIKSDEVKYLRLDMHRDVSAEKMSSTIGEAFDEHMPKNAPTQLRKQRKTFESYFKEECAEGNVIEFTYVPGKGTSMKQNGKSMGPVLVGKPFQEVLWDIYFGPDTCCDDLKEQILESCKK